MGTIRFHFLFGCGGRLSEHIVVREAGLNAVWVLLLSDLSPLARQVLE